LHFQRCDLLTDLQVYRSINPADKDDKHRFNTLQESILQLQKEFGIVLPDPNLVENEIQITSQYPVGAQGLYDLYSGVYLGKDVWCKKLAYGDPQGKAMMVRIILCLFVSQPNGVYSRGSGGRLISGVGCGRRIKSGAERKVLRLGSFRFTASTYPMKVPREFSQTLQPDLA
jgi:hypothetical protein